MAVLYINVYNTGIIAFYRCNNDKIPRVINPKINPQHNSLHQHQKKKCLT